MDEARLFSWTRVEVDESGRHSVKSINDVYIDLRESVFNFQEQQVFTKDTVLVDVDAVMYYKIVDVKKAVYELPKNFIEGGIKDIGNVLDSIKDGLLPGKPKPDSP